MEEIRLGSRTLQPHRQLVADGKRLPVGKRALDILSVLAEAGGEIVTKDELLDAVWPEIAVEENALQVHVVALRKALGPEAHRLETIRGVGYRLDLDGARADGFDEVEEKVVAPRSIPIRRTGSEPGGPEDTRPEAGAIGLWGRMQPLRTGLVLAAILGILIAAWALLGGGESPRADTRAPIIVRALTASGTGEAGEIALASGITDELIVRLRRIPELRIATARPDGSLPSDDFKHAYVVDGNLRSDGEDLRVTARLADAKGTIMWSETFDGRLADVFQVQERIAAAIAGALSIPLDVGANAIANGGTTNSEAYAAFVRSLVHSLDFDQTTRVRLLEEAISHDPGFVRARAQLSGSYGNRLPFVRTKEEADRMLAEMNEASKAAFRANPDSASISRAWYYVTVKDLPQAEQLMRRAAELDDGLDPQRRVALAQYAVTMGRNRKALTISESQVLIDPIYEDSPQKIFLLMMNGRYEESIELYERLVAAGQQGLQAQIYHVFWAQILAGREEEAVAFLKSFTQFPSFAVEAERFSTFPQMREFHDMTLPQIRRWAQENYGFGGQFPVVNMALTAAHRGHPRLAVNFLRVGFERPGGYALFYLWHPAMAEARETPEFVKLATDLGFPKAWRESEDWGDFCQPSSHQEIACE